MKDKLLSGGGGGTPPTVQQIDLTRPGSYNQYLFKHVESISIAEGCSRVIRLKVWSGERFTIDNFCIYHSEIWNESVETKIGNVLIPNIGNMVNPDIWVAVGDPAAAWFNWAKAVLGDPGNKLMTDTDYQFDIHLKNNTSSPPLATPGGPAPAADLALDIYWWLLVGVMSCQQIQVESSVLAAT